MAEEKTGSTDFRTAATNAGYKLVPEADYSGMEGSVNALKGLRALLPEEALGKEEDFLKTAVAAVGKVKELEDEGKTEAERLTGELKSGNTELEKLKTEKAAWETEKTGLQKDLKLSHMWGHVGAVQRARNVMVHEKFIDEADLEKFPLADHNTDTEENTKKLSEALWKSVLEPAHKAQTEVIRQVAPQRASDGDRNTDGITPGGTGREDPDVDADKKGANLAFGARA